MFPTLLFSPAGSMEQEQEYHTLTPYELWKKYEEWKSSNEQ
jgi:hypothetical protein